MLTGRDYIEGFVKGRNTSPLDMPHFKILCGKIVIATDGGPTRGSSLIISPYGETLCTYHQVAGERWRTAQMLILEGQATVPVSRILEADPSVDLAILSFDFLPEHRKIFHNCLPVLAKDGTPLRTCTPARSYHYIDDNPGFTRGRTRGIDPRRKLPEYADQVDLMGATRISSCPCKGGMSGGPVVSEETGEVLGLTWCKYGGKTSSGDGSYSRGHGFIRYHTIRNFLMQHLNDTFAYRPFAEFL